MASASNPRMLAARALRRILVHLVEGVPLLRMTADLRLEDGDDARHHIGLVVVAADGDGRVDAQVPTPPLLPARRRHDRGTGGRREPGRHALTRTRPPQKGTTTVGPASGTSAISPTHRPFRRPRISPRAACSGVYSSNPLRARDNATMAVRARDPIGAITVVMRSPSDMAPLAPMSQLPKWDVIRIPVPVATRSAPSTCTMSRTARTGSGSAQMPSKIMRT